MSVRTVLIANPSADTYGADLQMLETVSALVARRWRVVVTVPASGPLVPRLAARGAEVVTVPYPVLRRADVSLAGVGGLAVALPAALRRMRRLVRQIAPAVVYANTITVPWWLAVARATGTPSVCHVHEAEAADPLLVRRVLYAPLLLADGVIVNSQATEAVVCGAVPRLAARSRLVHNGVGGPATPPIARDPAPPYRLLVVGRLSPRKATRVALEALAVLRRAGRDVQLEVCGTPAPGHEAYAAALVERAQRPDLRGRVSFTGYVSPVWPALARADALVAPSLGESFGNAVVEAQLARRPVVATAVQGHLETVRHGVTGLLVDVQDPEAMAAAVARLMDDPRAARQMAYLAMRQAEVRFGTVRYAEEVDAVVAAVAERRPPAQVRSTSDVQVAESLGQLVEREA